MNNASVYFGGVSSEGLPPASGVTKPLFPVNPIYSVKIDTSTFYVKLVRRRYAID